MKWFRFYVEIVDDVKMLQLSDFEYRVFTYLMAYASEIDSTSGQLQTTFNSLSHRFRLRFNHFSRAIETFQKIGLVTISPEGYITITNWSKRQFKSDNSYSRVLKFREETAKRNVSCNVSVTAPDTDTDTEKKKKKKKITLTDEEWLNSLIANPAYKGIDVRALYGKMQVWCETNGKQATRRRLVNWLNRQEKPLHLHSQGKRPVSDYGQIPEYQPDLPEISEEERQRNLKKLKGFTESIGARAAPK